MLNDIQTVRQDYELASGGQTKLIWQYDEAVGGYGYTLTAQEGEQARAMTPALQPLVRGARFNLFPARIERRSPNALAFEGAVFEDGRLLYEWTGTAEAEPATGWVRIEIALQGEGKVAIGNGPLEPEIAVNLGELPPYERGDHVWFKTNIDNPTKWNDEARGNDFPACYYYDSYKKFGVMLFFDMSAMGWMAESGIERFLHYRCGLRRTYGYGPGELAVGLIGDRAFSADIPVAGTRFSYGIRCFSLDAPPTEQSAVVDLVEACLHFVPKATASPPNRASWREFGLKCAADLLDTNACWSNDGSCDMLIPYVNGVSPAWEESFKAKGLTIDFRNQPGLDAALMMIHPLTELAEAALASEYTLLRDKVWQYINHGGGEFLGEQPRIWGTWQYVYLLHEWWRAAWFREDEAACARIEEAVNRIVIPLARKTGYLFPLSFRAPELRKHGNGDNYPVAGAYAYFMLLLYKARKDAEYLAEAERSLQVLLQLPVNSLHQESFLLSMAVQAADGLERETGDPSYGEAYRYLLAQNLRMMYWYDDPSFADYRIWGMFQACTPMLYPAFFENIECSARIASTLKDRDASPGLLLAFNQARTNNYYCFPRCLPDKFRLSELQYIPLENLGTLEDDKTGYAGQEIYGAGQTFRAAMLWDQWLSCSEPDIYVMNLDGYELTRRSDVREARTFLIANLGETEKNCALETGLPSAGAVFEVLRGAAAAEERILPDAAGRVAVRLAPNERVKVRVKAVG
ncbi:hypothetical protein [Cohnella sp. GbtcB17]|uniref:hypothetical protein n=1 Tax=Cohnella sp. GbtcB17 TaxID=2824762 RepID=UPI001C2F72FD|nr:hypothetical protein [Cohnella sp. GbtcB17]